MYFKIVKPEIVNLSEVLVRIEYPESSKVNVILEAYGYSEQEDCEDFIRTTKIEFENVQEAKTFVEHSDLFAQNWINKNDLWYSKKDFDRENKTVIDS